MTSQSYQWLPEYNPYITNIPPGYQPLAHDTSNPIAYIMPLVFNNKGPMPLPTPPAHPAEFETYSHPFIPYTAPNTQPLHEFRSNNISSQNHSNGRVYDCHSSSSSNRSNRSSISTASGTSIQQCRSVFIWNLKPNAAWQNLREYLRPAGLVERCEVYNDRRSTRPGTAKATFRFTEEARKAVSMFDNSYFWGSRIRVVLGEESPGPGLMNGHGNDQSNNLSNAEHELLTGPMSNMTMDGDKKAKPNEPLVVNGSSVGAKTSIRCQEGKSCESPVLS